MKRLYPDPRSHATTIWPFKFVEYDDEIERGRNRQCFVPAEPQMNKTRRDGSSSEKEAAMGKFFSWEWIHWRGGLELVDLFDVVLLVDLPRRNLIKGRRFKHIFVDFDLGGIYIHYENEKSCRVDFHELTD